MNKESLMSGMLGLLSVGLMSSGVQNIISANKLLQNAEDRWRVVCTDTIKVGTNQLEDKVTRRIISIELSETKATQLRQQCVDVNTQNLKLTDMGEFTAGAAMILAGMLAIPLLVLRNRKSL